MRVAGRMAAVAMAAALAACGGGGGSGDAAASSPITNQPDTPADTTTSPDPDKLSAILSVGFYDMLAGPDRMMAKANAYAQLAGPASAGVTTACAIGSITTTKVSATSFTLAADNCHLLASDNLVYAGTWTFNITGNSYNPDGSCTQGSTCKVQAAVDVSNAKFGYGTATDDVVRGFWDQTRNADGTTTAEMQFPGAGFSDPDIGTLIVNGRTSAFTVDLLNGGTRILDVTAPSRASMTVRVPFKAILSVNDAGVTAAVDANGDGVAEKTVVVTWGGFSED